MRSRQWIALTWLLALALIGCDSGGSTSGPQSVTLDKSFQLRLGATAVLSPDNVQITFAKMSQDSRCPSDVQCAWAGQAVVQIQVAPPGGAPETADLTLGPSPQPQASATFGQYAVEFRDLEPYPITTIPINPNDYIATLVVSKQ
jgi:hypothetical protein